jgi:hypothetical protein
MMSRGTVETIRSSICRLKAVIEYDTDSSPPYGDDDAVRIVLLHRRYNDPSKGACGRTPNEVLAWAEENAEEWFTAALWVYEHSDVALRAGVSNPFACPWDSGWVGIVALKRSEWGRQDAPEPEREAALLEYAKNVAEEHGRWMNGECYGYTIIDPRDEDYDGDSCWGFVGFEHVENEATEALAYAAKELVDREGERVAKEIEASRPDMMEAR